MYAGRTGLIESRPCPSASFPPLPRRYGTTRHLSESPGRYPLLDRAAIRITSGCDIFATAPRRYAKRWRDRGIVRNCDRPPRRRLAANTRGTSPHRRYHEAGRGRRSRSGSE
jgi:hypothetical protein